MNLNQPDKKMYLTYLYATYNPYQEKKNYLKKFLKNLELVTQNNQNTIAKLRNINPFATTAINKREEEAIQNHNKAIADKNINFVRYKLFDDIIYIPITDVKSLKSMNAYLHPTNGKYEKVDSETLKREIELEGEISNNLREKRRKFDTLKSKIKSKFKTARNDIKSRYKTFKKNYNIPKRLRTQRLRDRDTFTTFKSNIKSILPSRKPKSPKYRLIDNQRRQKISNAFTTAKSKIKSILPGRKKTKKTKNTIIPITNNNNNRPTNINTKGRSFFKRILSVLPSRRTKTNFSGYKGIAPDLTLREKISRAITGILPGRKSREKKLNNPSKNNMKPQSQTTLNNPTEESVIPNTQTTLNNPTEESVIPNTQTTLNNPTEESVIPNPQTKTEQTGMEIRSEYFAQQNSRFKSNSSSSSQKPQPIKKINVVIKPPKEIANPSFFNATF